jgi:hypothetical protein
VGRGKYQVFSANVAGTGAFSTEVSWALQGSAASSINPAGVLTVGAGETASSLTVTATSKADPGKAASVTASIIAAASVLISPTEAYVAKGTSQTFSAQVEPDNSQGVTWSVAGGSASSITTGGVLTVGAGETAAFLSVTATSRAYPTASKTVMVYLNEIPVNTVTGVTITPNTSSVRNGTWLVFTALVEGTPHIPQGVTWSVRTNTGAATSQSVINAAGALTVGDAESASSLVVTAVSTTDPSKSASATVTIVRVTRVTVSPATVSVKEGGTQQVTATVQGVGGPAQGIDWIVDPDPWDWESTSTITADGTLYVAEGESAPRLRVKAVSWEDNRVFGYATVTVTHADDPPKFPPLIAK